MKKLWLVLFAALAFASCNKGSDDNGIQEYVMDGYQASDNPLDNLSYCFQKAQEILGPDAKFYMLEGIQVGLTPSKDYSLAWQWYFAGGNSILQFDVKGKKIYKYSGYNTGCEFLSSNDPRLVGMMSPKDIFTSYVTKKSKDLLYMRLYVPVVTPSVKFYYYLFSDDKVTSWGTNSFVFDAYTGVELAYPN